MKIVRAIVVLILFIAAVLLASANEGAVELIYLPELPLAGFEQARSVMLPTFLLVLGSLGLGGLLGGGLALFQQAGLKFRLRRAEKDNARLTNDVAAVREKLGLVTAQLDDARRESAELRTQLEGPLVEDDAIADATDAEAPGAHATADAAAGAGSAPPAGAASASHGRAAVRDPETPDGDGGPGGPREPGGPRQSGAPGQPGDPPARDEHDGSDDDDRR